MTTGRIDTDYKSEKRNPLRPRRAPLTANKVQKQLAEKDSQRDARNFVYRHKDLILGASDAEVEMAVTKIAKALTELRESKINAEIAKRRAETHGPKRLKTSNEARSAAFRDRLTMWSATKMGTLWRLQNARKVVSLSA